MSPITGGNWEAVGVEPDVMTSASDAFDVAYRTILDMLVADEEVPTAVREEARIQSLDEA